MDIGQSSGGGSTQQKVVGWNSHEYRTISGGQTIAINDVPAFTSVFGYNITVTGCGLTTVPSSSSGTSNVRLTLEDGTLSVTARSGYTGTLYLYKPIYG